MALLDTHGQPIIRSAGNVARLMDRGLDELIGFCKGTIADGILNQTEAEAVLAWIKRNPQLATAFPANVIFARLTDALEDGVLDREEAKDVFELIAECVGATGDIEMESCTSTLPFDSPQPELVFPKKNFVLTGRFAWGPREDVASVVKFLGGTIKTNVSGVTDYLICGHFASPDWIHSSYGRKIQAAMDFRDKGYEVAIVSERYWSDTVRSRI